MIIEETKDDKKVVTDIHSNVTIDFSPKNNRRSDDTPEATPEQKTETTTSPRPPIRTSPRPSSSARPQNPRRGRPPRRPSSPMDTDPKMNSSHFVNHKYADILPVDVRPKPGEEPVRIGSLLGLEQVGQCIFIEYKDDIIIVDAGMEFAGDNATMGADYLIPDISYLKKKKKNIRGILLTHGHLDHIGALPDILPELGFPTIYSTPLTLGLVRKKLEERKLVHKMKYHVVNPDTDLVQTGCFTTEFVRVNHNIPETFALSIHTPKGVVFTSADFKFDHAPAIDKPADIAKISRIGTEGVKLYIGDSLGCSNPGFARSEKEVGETLAEIVKSIPGRLIVATFASNVGRVIQIIEAASKAGKTVFLTGRSMINYTDVAIEVGYIKVPKGTIHKLSRFENNLHSYAPEKTVIICTGAQGEEFSALARMSRDEFQQVKLQENDTILMSSSVIPGNEKQTHKMMNDLVKKEVRVITNKDMDIHASGHGGAEDHKLMLGLVKPDFFLPFYIDAVHRYAHRNLALDMGFADDTILMPNENGSIIEIYDSGCRVSERKLRLQTVMVDGKGIGHLAGEYVMKARQIMANDGMVSLIFKVDTEGKDLVGNIQIESRGFVYSAEVKRIHTSIVDYARKQYNYYHSKKMTVRDILRRIKDDLTKFIIQLIDREPMIIPMFVYINTENEENPSDDVTDEESIVGMTLESQGSRNS